MFNLQSHWKKAKRIIGDGWHSGLKIAGQIDRGMNVGRRLVGALSPAINAMGGGHMKALEAGFTQYDQSRNQVVSGINNVQTMHSRLKRAVPEIDL
jgi:hypothetical protein